MNKRTELMQKNVCIYIKLKRKGPLMKKTSVLIFPDEHTVHLNYHLTCLI